MSGYTTTPVLQDAYTALIALIGTITGLPPSNIILGAQNRASMPLPGFVLVQALHMSRLLTNLNSWDTTNPLAATQSIEEDLELTVQIDCYGPLSNPGLAWQWATQLSSVLRDAQGCDALAPNVTPLYADEARFMPLTSAEDQYEARWSLDAHLQINPVTTAPQQFANDPDMTLVSVAEKYH